MGAPDRAVIAPSAAMEAGPVPVLFTHYGDQWIRGSEQVLLDLLGKLDRRRFSPIVWTNVGPLADRTEADRIPTYRGEFAYYLTEGLTPPNPVRYACLVGEGLSLVRRHGVRLIHANSAAPVQWLAPVKWLKGVPLLVHLHSIYHRRSRYALLLHQASCAVGVSEAVVKELRNDGMPPHRVRVVHNGIDFSRFGTDRNGSLRAELGIPLSAPLVAAVGSLITRKGFDVLLRAFSKQDANAHLCIVGDGPGRAALEQMAGALGIEKRVHFLGYQNDPTPLYPSADVFALASRSEALPLVLAEAGFFGLPAICTDVGGSSEVVEHERTGLLVPPEDVGAFAAALERVTGDADFRLRLARSARDRVISLFNVADMTLNFEQIYDWLLGGRATISGGFQASLVPYRRLLSGR
ncbi:MAG: glycosyltransferase [Acetobacteraceae bacterium]